jgi:aryl-alcohol dehydrogenase-like predicted oxidoreductase
MEQRVLGRTGLQVSALGFGCGNVGGLMIRGAASDQERAVARAIELGINYFDTAAMYGEGRSETNLGRALATLHADVVVASKVRIDPASETPFAEQIATSADQSLRRLQRDRIDVFQLHTPTMLAPERDALDVRAVIDEVVPAFEALRAQGKIRFYGFSGTGDPRAFPALVDARAFDVAQIIYNLLNPSAAAALLSRFVGPDFGGVIDRAREASMGVVAIRVLAGGALSGSEERHPTASAAPAPMGSSGEYRADVAFAHRLRPLVDEGHAGSLAEAALRFAVSHPAVSTALIGFSDLDQVERAAAAVEKGPLSDEARELLGALTPR